MSLSTICGMPIGTVEDLYDQRDELLAEVRKLRRRLRDARAAMGDYAYHNGCGCCRNEEKHREAATRLGKLLGVKQFSDKSGYDFTWYRKDKP